MKTGWGNGERKCLNIMEEKKGVLEGSRCERTVTTAAYVTISDMENAKAEIYGHREKIVVGMDDSYTPNVGGS